MAELEADSQADLRGYLLILRRRKLVIAVTFLVVLALALAYSYITTPEYTATATVLVPEQQASSALNVSNQQLQDPTALQRLLVDAQQFAQGDAVKSDATKALGFKPKVSVGVSTTADVLTFTASNTDPAEAAKIANGYALAYITANRANQVAQYTDEITGLETSISQLEAKAATVPPGSPQAAALQSSITAINQSVEQAQAAAQVVNQVGPSVVNSAVTPTSPSSPKKSRNGLLGGVVGIILGIGLAFLWERLDDGLNSRVVVERIAGGLPIVGLLPVVDSWKVKNSHHVALIEDPNSNIAEAYRTLRTGVQFMGIEHRHKVIAVTSSIPGEGKSTLAANLAVSFARAGQRVVLVSCDLRRPRVHEFFGLSNDVGLTSVLIGRAALNDAVVSVSSEPRLRVVASGPVPPNPAEILSLNRIVTVVDALAKWADIVILDCPPVLPVSDTLLLSRLADGVLVLASVPQTTTKQLRRTFELLEQVDAPTLGVVLNRVPTDKASYGYEYGYYRADHYRSEEMGQMARTAVDTDSGESFGLGTTRGGRAGSSEPRSEELVPAEEVVAPRARTTPTSDQAETAPAHPEGFEAVLAPEPPTSPVADSDSEQAETAVAPERVEAVLTEGPPASPITNGNGNSSPNPDSVDHPAIRIWTPPPAAPPRPERSPEGEWPKVPTQAETPSTEDVQRPAEPVREGPPASPEG